METPANRTEFEHNLYLVFEDIDRKIRNRDKLGIRSISAFTISHVKRVMVLPNRRIDLITIDESLRLQANTINMMQNLPPITLEKDEDYNDQSK